MLLLGDLKIIVIIKGMSNQVIRCSITLIHMCTTATFLANSDCCDVSKAHLFIYLPLWPNYYHVQTSLFGFVSSISIMSNIQTEEVGVWINAA